MVIGFEKLCKLYSFDFGLDEFRSLYRLNVNKDNSCYFCPLVRGKRLILELPDNDHGWEKMIAFVGGMWESNDPLDQTLVPRRWTTKGISFLVSFIL